MQKRAHQESSSNLIFSWHLARSLVDLHEFTSIQIEVWNVIENLTMEIYFEEDGILMNATDSDGPSYPIDRNVTVLPRLNQGL